MRYENAYRNAIQNPDVQILEPAPEPVLPRPEKSLTEHQEQRLLIAWRDAMSERHPEVGLLFAIPNGGYRLRKTAAILKAEGVTPGVPDLFLPVARNGHHGLFIEMKRAKGGRVSKDQKQMIQALRAQGYRVEVCHGAHQAVQVIMDYLGL